MFGHDYEWHRAEIVSRLVPDHSLWKWRGVCRRCDHWTTKIPREFVSDFPDEYPELRKFIRDNTR